MQIGKDGSPGWEWNWDKEDMDSKRQESGNGDYSGVGMKREEC